MIDVIYEAIPQFFGILQLIALRELIDSFADGPDGDKSYAYLMCSLLLIGQAAEGKKLICRGREITDQQSFSRQSAGMLWSCIVEQD